VNGVVIALVAVVMGWFAIGSVLNVRRGQAAMRWMQDGLRLVGERTTVRWIGTTSVELAIAKAEPPFSQLKLVVFLEPRDVPWLWALTRRRGRRDTLIVVGQLVQAPAQELEALDRRSWSGREALRRARGQRWSAREAVAGRLEVLYKYDAALPLADSLVELAAGTGVTVRRLGLRRAEPHLQLHVDLPAAETSAAEFFARLRTIGERASKG